MRKKLLFLILSLCCLQVAWAQQASPEKKRRAQEFYVYGRFEEARGVLISDRVLSRIDKEGRFLLALCHYQLNELDRAALLLNALIEEESTPYPECWLYMGKIFHARHQFDKAADYYKAYLKLMDKRAEERRLIWDDLERCANGLAMRYKEQRAFAENLGASVNTEYDEFAPILSPTRNDRLYFSSARRGSIGGLRNAAGQLDDRFGRYRSDMYVCQQERGTWKNVEPMDYLLNSPANDILLDIRNDGAVLYYFNGDAQGGQLKTDTFRSDGERLLTSDLFPGPIDPRRGDRYPHFVNDTLVFFASTRPGGYGGYDLYKIAYADGRWSAPRNLGPDINSSYDEITPFQARDMRTLYFSTDNPVYGIGGLDVVKAVYVLEFDRWLPPENVGMPINSAGDDTHFRLSKDGFSGFLTSSRKDGFGQRDIYAVYYQDFLPEMEPPHMPVMAQNEPPVRPAVPSPPTIVEEPPPPVAEAPPPPAVEIPETPAIEPEPPVLDMAPVVTAPEPNVEVAIAKPVIETAPSQTEERPPAETELPPPATETPSVPALIQPILVEDGANFDDRDREVLDALARALAVESGRRLVVTTYSNQQLNRARQINEGINLSESVASYLYQQGVPSSSLFLRAALADLSKVPNQARVVAFNFAASGEMTPKGETQITLENPWLDLGGHKLHQKLLYKVQVAASKRNNFNDRILEEYIDPMVEKFPDFPYYRYTVGAFPAYKLASQLRREMIQFGAKRAFPIPYVEGWRLEGKEIQRKSAAYPDLKNFLGGAR